MKSSTNLLWSQLMKPNVHSVLSHCASAETSRSVTKELQHTFTQASNNCGIQVTNSSFILFGEANYTANQVLEIFKSIILTEPSDNLLYRGVESIKTFNTTIKVLKHTTTFIICYYRARIIKWRFIQPSIEPCKFTFNEQIAVIIGELTLLSC